MFSIRSPQATTILAAIICAINFTQLGIPLQSSIKQVIPNTKMPMINPINFSAYWSSLNS